jgi:hypothetical protein
LVSGQEVEAVADDVIGVVLVGDGKHKVVVLACRSDSFKRVQDDVETFGRAIALGISQRIVEGLGLESRVPDLKVGRVARSLVYVFFKMHKM